MSEKDAGIGNPRGLAITAEDGRYRFANLLPGTYYLAAGPFTPLPETACLNFQPEPKTGYPGVYYPGVPDLASASPISLSAGQQAEANFALNEVPAYNISGTISGYAPNQGVEPSVVRPVREPGLLLLSVQSGQWPLRLPRGARRGLCAEGVFAVCSEPASSRRGALECRFQHLQLATGAGSRDFDSRLGAHGISGAIGTPARMITVPFAVAGPAAWSSPAGQPTRRQ